MPSLNQCANTNQHDKTSLKAQVISSTTDKQTYTLGQHGAKGREQKRLTEKYETPISGKTHESEHTIGFAVLNDTGDKRGANKNLRKLENEAPAYQERRALHREHIGTGSRTKVDGSGFSAPTYRLAQRRSLEDGDVSSATQLNQLGYAFLDGFQEKQDSPARKAARDSYDVMVENMKEVKYTKGGQEETALVDERQQAEMHLARRAAETGKWPTAEEIAAAKKKFGVVDNIKKPTSLKPTLGPPVNNKHAVTYSTLSSRAKRPRE